jgi:cobalamin biosynthetic protein CobC
VGVRTHPDMGGPSLVVSNPAIYELNPKDFQQPLTHGGGLLKEGMIDLSTGISPWSYPIPEIPISVYQSLPVITDCFMEAVEGYYGAAGLPVCGSQAAIEIIPLYFSSHFAQRLTVAILGPTYSEHAFAWFESGARVLLVKESCLESILDDIDVLVIVNPNNPTGRLIPQVTLERWRLKLESKGAYLIVDEAFIDAEPECHARTMIRSQMPSNLVVLRSLGKFFGLAGLRLGFVFAPSNVYVSSSYSSAVINCHSRSWR